ncbi:hypothetical protein CDAR_255141 [Caerostris darwini]|uniref:Uncharacterized protein n=1 Tax=Caerostris darwini TaxID=1538125 RepID=A0AAV4VBJ7_9ARAC|nr:hypothetical protein CDAR_255141 [Caerostris darwini]
MSLLSILFLMTAALGSCAAQTFPPRRVPIPPPYQPIPHNTFHALYFDATRQAYIYNAFAVMRVMRAEWKKAVERMVMMPFTHG